MQTEFVNSIIDYSELVLQNIPDGQKSLFNSNSIKSIGNLLSLVDKELTNPAECTFFEFGSKHYSFPRKNPFSPAVSHYFMQYSDLEYFCFDPESNKQAYVEGVKILEDIIHKGKMQYPTIMSSRDLANLGLDMIRDHTTDYFSNQKIAINYIENLSKLIPKIDSAALNYGGICNKIAGASNPVIFSNSVLNYPVDDIFGDKGLQYNYPFWNIKKGFHIHRVCHEEILKQIGYSEKEADYLSLGEFTAKQIDDLKNFFNISSSIHVNKEGSFGCVELYWHTDSKNVHSPI